MDLAQQQRSLLGLVRGSAPPRLADPYLQRVAESADLQEARGNILLWRVYVLERTCVLTVPLLRQLARLDAVLDDFMRCRNVSPFREFQPLAFLEFLSGDDDDLVASVAQFELALMKVREGDASVHVVRWNREPSRVLKSLAENALLESNHPGGRYVTNVAAALPYLFDVQPDGSSASSR